MRKKVKCDCGWSSNPHRSIVKLSFLRNGHDEECDSDPEIVPVEKAGASL